MKPLDLLISIVIASVVMTLVLVGMLKILAPQIREMQSTAYDDFFEENKPELKELFVETLEECIKSNLCEAQWEN